MAAIRNIKEEWDNSVPLIKNKMSKLYGAENSLDVNPFLGKNGKVFNEYLDYQGLLDNPTISTKVKQFITEATGLSPTTPTPTPATSAGSGLTPVTPSGTAQVTATGNGIADAAQKYIGTPYVWGGESAAEGGMDCSGFVYNALKDAGVNIGRTTAQGYRSGGASVSKADLLPGDLVFYGNNNNATHVGVYIGSGKIVHSAGGSKNTKNNPGKGVSVATLDHRSDFIEARRYS